MTEATVARLSDDCCTGGGKKLLSIADAMARAAAYVEPMTRVTEVDLTQAPGRTLAQTVLARVANPRFDQSAMDGYALASVDVPPGGAHLPVAGRVPAGRAAGPLTAGAAMRVFTGAPLPQGADAVVMQEHVTREGDVIHVSDSVRPGANIRRVGEDICVGDLLLEPGVRLDARHVALVAGQGISRLRVTARPRIAVFSTGDELREPGAALEEAAIYDSNRMMLLALARQAGCDAHDGGCVADDPYAIAARLRELAAEADIVVSSGGASVGEEDHAAAAIVAAGGKAEALRIAMKPGKPAVVGRVGAAACLCLPGNPVAALVSWLLLGGAMTAALCGRAGARDCGAPMRAASRFAHRKGRTEFAPARVVSTPEGLRVEILGRGGSARLKPLVEADGLAAIDAGTGDVEPGDAILFRAFHGGFMI